MALGIVTDRKHLNQFAAADWTKIRAWAGADLEFAGRYFLGGRVTQEAAGPGMATIPVFNWAHGEGAYRARANSLKRIAPIQAGVKERQEIADAKKANAAGWSDGRAACARVTSALTVGDVTAAGQLIWMFLEVAKDTKLSADYWAGWSNAVASATVTRGTNVTAPFIACLFCWFEKNAENKLVPVESIRTALAHDPADKRKSRLCRAFWARSEEGWAAGTVVPKIDATTFEPFKQTVVDVERDVPVTLWQFTASSDADFKGLSLDVSADGEFGKFMLSPAPDWAPRNGALPMRYPVMSRGVDTAGIKHPSNPALSVDTSTLATAIKTTRIVLVPDRTNSLNGYFISFVGRYFSNLSRTDPDANKLTLDKNEKEKLIGAGLSIVSIWQGPRGGFKNDWNNGGAYFANGFGFGEADALSACAFARSRGQDRWTPIYFAVDYNPKNAEELENISDYFAGVAWGCSRAAADTGERPYEVGVYGVKKVLEECYKKGYASYFWDLNINAADYFDHTNLAQPIRDKPEIFAGTTLAVDYNLAWGDEGSWGTK